jgi:hypothetical protein
MEIHLLLCYCLEHYDFDLQGNAFPKKKVELAVPVDQPKQPLHVLVQQYKKSK